MEWKSTRTLTMMRGGSDNDIARVSYSGNNTPLSDAAASLFLVSRRGGDDEINIFGDDRVHSEIFEGLVVRFA